LWGQTQGFKDEPLFSQGNGKVVPKMNLCSLGEWKDGSKDKSLFSQPAT